MAGDFDGVDQFIGFGDVHDFERTDKFSWGGWVKADSATPSTRQFLFGKLIPSGAQSGYFINIRGAIGGDPIEIEVRNSVSDKVSIRWDGLGDTLWHHLLATYDGSSTAAGLNLYVDGALAGGRSVQDDSLSASILHNNAWTIGAGDSGAIAFAGEVADVRVYDEELALERVATIFNSLGKDTDVQGGQCRWRLDELPPGSTMGGAGSVKDMWGSQANGTPTNSPTYATDILSRLRRRR